MENTNRDTAQNAAPQNDWQNVETANAQNNEGFSSEGTLYDTVDGSDEDIQSMAGIDVPDPDEDEDDETEDDNDEEAGDWGHVDPAEDNSPFPDPNAPTAPGSAV